MRTSKTCSGIRSPPAKVRRILIGLSHFGFSASLARPCTTRLSSTLRTQHWALGTGHSALGTSPLYSRQLAGLKRGPGRKGRNMTPLIGIGVIALLVLITILSGLFTVDQQTSAVVERFGKFRRVA